ncbi:protein kinase [Altericista sp. CCNU0014]|uniref:protein kinase domain-containing protein n=1 Tax=Altericista sp. CCNU0014 TaxID=3082949 RepID=UPI00384AA120
MSGLRLCHQGHSNPLSSRYCNQCGVPLKGEDDPIEKVMGDRYRIVRDIGHGGFGRTYLAEDINRFNEYCVLKELAPAAENQDLEKAKELFAREAEVLYKLEHPQIPKFREWFTESTRQSMFLVQDYAEGPTYQDILRDRQRQGRTFVESEIVTLLSQLLPVLSYIHGRGVVHRDLSPDNLICRNSDRLPVLIDFGGVKEVAASTAKARGPAGEDRETSNVTLIGKPGYSPEEQMRRGQVSAASDLYALGVTALVLLVGQDPADFYDAFHLTFDWRDRVPVSPGLAAILDKMVAHRVAERYTTAEQVLADIKALSHKQTDWVAPPQQHWPTASEPQSAQQTTGSFKTVVVAPLGTAVATSAALPRRAASPLAGAARGLSAWIWQKTAALARGALVGALLLGAGGLGWAAVRWWFQSQQPSASAPSAAVSAPSVQQARAFSASERQRKAELINRLERSGVSSGFFYRLANEAYYLQYPDQRGRLLSNGPEDEALRANWDGVASQVMDTIEPLRPAARDRLGRYTEGDRTSWVAQLRGTGRDPDRFFEQVESQLTDALPMYRGVDLRSRAALQLANGIAADRMVETGRRR